jgi:NADH dehydrogenase
LICAAGVKGNVPNGIEINEQGKGSRIITDEFCKMKGSDNIYVTGDVGLIQSEKYPNGLPMLGSVAMQQGVYLAHLFNRKARSKNVQAFVYKDKGIMATIGRNAAIVEMGSFKIQGFLAWMIWMFVHLMLLVGFRNRVVVFINWLWKYINFNNSLRLIIHPYKK